MTDLGDPFTKRPLMSALEKVHDDVGMFFITLPTDDFFHQPPDAWSPFDNLRHLIKSVKAVSRAMKIPKIVLRILFGVSPKISRRYRKITEIYRGELGKGAKASWFYSPGKKDLPSEPEQAKETFLRKWEKTGFKLLSIIEKWEDRELDKYRLPHPILGKITVREMLFFTLYHNQHHIASVKKRLEKATVS